MNELESFFSHFPTWAGNVPMWGVFAMVLIALIKVWPKLKEIGVNERQGIRDPYIQRIRELADDVKHCRQECDEQERRLRHEIDGVKRGSDEREAALKERIDVLRTRVNNEAFQRVQSEISLVNTLIQVVDAPQLRTILKALEDRKAILPSLVELKDKEGNGK